LFQDNWQRRRTLFEEYVPINVKRMTVEWLHSRTRTRTRTWRSHRYSLKDQQQQQQQPLSSSQTSNEAAAIWEDDMLPEVLRDALRYIVARSSRIQTLKGFLTAGPWRSLRYAWHKFNKRFSSTPPPSSSSSLSHPK
jgi:hypothetical protein